MLDFYDAHLRHLRDAEILYAQSRFANADHLYGFAAECGLKRLMLRFGMPMGGHGPQKKKDRIHADEIWKRYESYRSKHVFGAQFMLCIPPNPFVNWNAHQRYEHQSQFNQVVVDPHKAAALHVNSLIKKAQLKGLIL